MEAFYRTHRYLIEHTNTLVRRNLMDEIDWNDRLIGIKGSRGVGKTTSLLQYAKERYGSSRACLYLNMNNLYFTTHTLLDFANQFQREGGKVLLIDQIFKYPNWAQELGKCYELYPDLKIIFTSSSVTDLTSRDENPEVCDIVKSYSLGGFSFREYLNLTADLKLHPYTLEEILVNHERISKGILAKVNPLVYFQDYLHHGYYPFYLEHRNFSENLLKTMNMMVEVDILLIKQIDLKYLSKIKKLLYLLAVEGAKAPNVSQLAKEIDTSRATIMNYIKYLEDARLLNMVHQQGDCFPKKPSKIFMHNTNLMYAIYPIQINEQDLLETFVITNLWKDHQVSLGSKRESLYVDGRRYIKICFEGERMKNNADVINLLPHAMYGKGNQIPLWLFGFLY